jgi:hypothetical protein
LWSIKFNFLTLFGRLVVLRKINKKLRGQINKMILTVHVERRNVLYKFESDDLMECPVYNILALVKG